MAKETVYKPVQPYSKKDNTPSTSPAYQKSFLDYLRENGKQIHGFISFQGSTTTTLYTCPVGREFYLIFVSATATNDAAISIPTLDLLLNNKAFFTLSSGKLIGIAVNQAASFPIPIRLTAGNTLKAYNNRANCWLRVTFLGFEVASSTPQ